MATGLKSRIAYKEPNSSAVEGEYWAGTYKLLMRAKSIPSPFGSQNMVDTSTLEDLVETQEMGRRAAGSMEVPGAFEKKYKDDMVTNEAKNLTSLFFTELTEKVQRAFVDSSGRNHLHLTKQQTTT